MLLSTELFLLLLSSSVVLAQEFVTGTNKRQILGSVLDTLESIFQLSDYFYDHEHSEGYTNEKSVVAHMMVGNTYPYNLDNWRNDIALALARGIDGFALNIGSDDWQYARVADAYNAAVGTSFKLFISFDMTVIPCGSSSDQQRIRDYISEYHNHPNQFRLKDRAFVSTFGGEQCSFGAGNLNDGWYQTLRSPDMPPVWFMPSFFVDPANFPGLPIMDGYFEWNAGWPFDGSDAKFDSDNNDISHLNGRPYMAPVSPWFFTHYGPATYNKNWIYRPDNWLFVERWELLIQNRDKVDIVEVISWNDYGESHYIGPIQGAQPMSDSWVNGFDHQGWLELQEYYISAFKNGGTYPKVTKDKIFLWSRLYPVNADVPQDAVGKPWRSQYTEDYLWAVLFSTGGSVSVTLSCGSYTETSNVSGSGAFKIKMSFNGASAGGQVSAVVKRDGASVVDFSPAGFVFDRNPKSYNFNAFVASSG